jgi:hypothetical protein
MQVQPWQQNMVQLNAKKTKEKNEQRFNPKGECQGNKQGPAAHPPTRGAGHCCWQVVG